VPNGSKITKKRGHKPSLVTSEPIFIPLGPTFLPRLMRVLEIAPISIAHRGAALSRRTGRVIVALAALPSNGSGAVLPT